MKTILIILALFVFASCERCEYCTTSKSVVYSGDTVAPMRYNEYNREECGGDNETRTIKRVETRNNITITTTEVTTCR